MEQNGNDKTLSEVALKIKKLLALSKSANEHEAALAAVKATELLEKYNMTLTDIEIETAEMVEDKITTGFKRTPKWVFRLGVVIADNTYTRILVGNKYLKVLGARADVETANYLFHYLYKTISELSKEHASQYYNKIPLSDLMAIKFSYCDGVLSIIKERLSEFKRKQETSYTASGTELVPVKTAALDKWYYDKYPQFKDKKGGYDITSNGGFSMNSFRQGQEDGRNIPLHKGVRGSNSLQGRIA